MTTEGPDVGAATPDGCGGMACAVPGCSHSTVTVCTRLGNSSKPLAVESGHPSWCKCSRVCGGDQ